MHVTVTGLLIFIAILLLWIGYMLEKAGNKRDGL